MSVPIHLSEAQEGVIRDSLIRRGFEFAPGTNVSDWLNQQNLLIQGSQVAMGLLAQDSGGKDRHNSQLREEILCALGRADFLARGRRAALAQLLGAIEYNPALLGDSRRLRLTVQGMNSILERHLSESFELLDRAFERFNDNVALGRPVLTALDVLQQELHELGVFFSGNNSNTQSSPLNQCSVELARLIDTAKAGKVHAPKAIKDIIARLDYLVRSAYDEEARYWYNDIMVKHYVRDTIIPNAVLNDYIHPLHTTDLLGAILHFVQDAATNPNLVYCSLLLFHQPQQPGSRFASTSDLLDELKLRHITPTRWADISERLSEKKNRLPKKSLPENLSFNSLRSRPFVRLARAAEFIPYALGEFAQDAGCSKEALTSWSSNSLFAIDPGDGFVTSSLAAALKAALDDLANGSLRVSKLQSAEKYQSIFLDALDSQAATAVAHLWAPFEAAESNPDYRLDAFELREALVNLILEGVCQEDSDWPEEGALIISIKAAIESIRVFAESESPNLDDVERAFTGIASALEKIYHRANRITIDVPGIIIWYLLTFSAVANANNTSVKSLVEGTYNNEPALPTNAIALKSLLTPENRLLLDKAFELIRTRS